MRWSGGRWGQGSGRARGGGCGGGRGLGEGGGRQDAGAEAEGWARWRWGRVGVAVMILWETPEGGVEGCPGSGEVRRDVGVRHWSHF